MVRDQRQQRRGVGPFDALQLRLLGAGPAGGDKPRREAEFDGDVDESSDGMATDWPVWLRMPARLNIQPGRCPPP
jgi:hypothetical protein